MRVSPSLNLIRGGHSLIELVFAFSFIALFLLIVLNLVPASMVAMRSSERRLYAEQLAQSQIDSYSSLPFSQLTPGVLPVVKETSSGIEFNRQVRIFTPPDTAAQRTLGVEVVVSWLDAQGAQSTRRQVWVSRAFR